MSDNRSNTPLSRIDTSRRSFLHKGALASGAIAFGGAAAGCVGAEEHDEDEVGPDDDTNDTNDDHVLMLYPDAVENASARIVSDEIDWLPWEDDDAPDDMDDDPVNGDDPGDDANDVDANDEPGDEDPTEDEHGEYRTHLVEFEFSASHVAPVFLPDEAEFDIDEDVQLGEIEELLHGPDDPIEDIGNGTNEDTDDDLGEDDTDDTNGVTNGIGEDGEAVLVRIGLDEEEVTEDPEEEPDDEPDDDPIDDDDDEPADDPADDDDGIFDDDDDDEPADEPADDDDGILDDDDDDDGLL